MVQLGRQRTWVAVEGAFDVEVLAQALGFTVTVALADHAPSVLVFELPNILLENEVHLFFYVQSIPQVEVVHFLVVLRDVLVDPDLVKYISLHSHAPYMLAVLHK